MADHLASNHSGSPCYENRHEGDGCVDVLERLSEADEVIPTGGNRHDACEPHPVLVEVPGTPGIGKPEHRKAEGAELDDSLGLAGDGCGHHAPVDGNHATDGHHHKLPGHDDEGHPHRRPINRHQRNEDTAHQDLVGCGIEKRPENRRDAPLAGDGPIQVVGERGDRDQECRNPEQVRRVGAVGRQDKTDDRRDQQDPEECETIW